MGLLFSFFFGGGGGGEFRPSFPGNFNLKQHRPSVVRNLRLPTVTVFSLREVHSRLYLNKHVYRTDTSVKRTPRFGLCPSLLPLFDSLKTHIILRPTLSAPPKGDCLKEN